MSSWHLSDSPINKLWRNIDGTSQNLLNDQDKIPVIGCLKSGIKSSFSIFVCISIGKYLLCANMEELILRNKVRYQDRLSRW